MAIRTLLQSCVLLPFLLLAFVLLANVPLSLGDRGTAERYEPSPSRTQYCGDNPSQFPKGKKLAFVTDTLWDSGIACWREYDLQCDGPPFCKAGSSPVRYMVAGLAADIPEGVDFALPPDSFGAIANSYVDSLPIDYKEV